MKVLFAAQDPGGANAIVPVAAAFLSRGDAVLALVSRAARNIFATQNIPLRDPEDMPDDSLNKLVDEFAPDCIVTSTSVGDSIDKRITLRFKDTTPCISIIDFWSNYAQRFSTLGTKDLLYMPSVICVIDELMRDEMLVEGFAPEHIVVTGNPHYDHFADAITRANEDQHEILFISQPLRDQANMPGFASLPFDEYTALEDLIASVARLGRDYRISIRLHPKEDAHKFDQYFSAPASLASSPTLEQSISHAGLVVGMVSPVLLQAAAAGKCVLSYEPGFVGLDPLVSNRVGVTTRASSRDELDAAIAAYVSGDFPQPVKKMRSIWPSGATERVIETVLAQSLKK